MPKNAASSPVGALQYLVSPDQINTGPVCAITGDDGFLCHEVRVAIQSAMSQSVDDDLSLSAFGGKTTELRDDRILPD